MREYKPNEIIIDRVVELWKRMLVKPKFDNGDKSSTGFVTKALVEMNDATTNNSSQEVLDRFGVELKSLLMTEVSLEQLQEKPETDTSRRYFHTSLGCDYGPDWVLACAAKRVGLTTQFPWKTNMSFNESYLSLGHGYGAPWVSHYPISGNRWLVAQLSGEDIAKVIEYVEGGMPTFTIEQGAAQPQVA